MTEREEFEAWWRGRWPSLDGRSFERRLDGYCSPLVDMAWDGWQARGELERQREVTIAKGFWIDASGRRTDVGRLRPQVIPQAANEFSCCVLCGQPVDIWQG